MGTDHFGEKVAQGYDTSDAVMFDPTLIERTVDFLADHAAGGSALELGIGTGRIALPLARRGITVHGIDLSPAMLQHLRAKAGSDDISITVGDFARDRAPDTFALVYLVFNTIMNLTTQDEQVACFCNAAAQMRPGGRFVVEVMVPDLQRLPAGETVRPFTVTATQLGFDEYDIASQKLVSHHYRVMGEQVDTMSIPFRYVWPSELDLMARIAGMSLRERWSDWNRAPFTSDSRRHVSVWQLPDSIT